ncbi:MAG: VWA domain-containing protein [Myxococcota bacterium]|nr:VWA domain-containing protein [Myxococcota bacterium]
MGFETPLALLALAAAALPVIAHLLRRQDLPKRRLPTVALLRRAEASSKRRVRLVDLLLLIARVLLIALAALAVAGPFVRERLAYGDGSVASVAVVIDDSMSMAERGAPSLLAQAVERAGAIVDSLPPGSEVAIVLAGAAPRTLVARTDELDRARRALEAVPERSARGSDLAAALERAERELAGARHADRRVVVLSDVAAHAGADDASPPGPGVSLRFERIGEDAEARNAAVVLARATPDPTTPGQVSIAVEIRASADFDGERLPLRLERAGEPLVQTEVAIERGGARATLHAPVSADEPGALVVLEVDDAIEADDTRPVLLRPPAGVRVLVVHGDVGGGEETRFFDRAIDLAPDDEGALSRRSVDPDTFAAMDLADAEVVVLVDAPAPSPRVAARLREHVEAGGGLWIAPGAHFDARAYEARLGDLMPARPQPPVSSEVGGPLPSAGGDLFPAGASGLEGTETRRRIGFEGLDPNADTLLRFEDDSPALVVGAHGDGRVALTATSLGDDWTTLPYRPGFLPLVARLARRLAPRASTPDAPIAPGASLALRPPAGVVRMRVSGPGGELADVRGADLEDALQLEDTVRAGVYRVQVATADRPLHEEPRLAFLVAPPPEESDLSPGEVPDGVEASAAGDASAVVARPLAPWLFLLVGLLAVTEAALRLRASHLARASA